MPKPIVLMYIPDDHIFYDRNISATDMMYNMNGWNEKVTPRPEIAEYLWFVFKKDGIKAPEMQVFHPKDFTEIQFEELKQLAIEEFKKMNQL